MNERIRELAEQAGEYVNKVYTGPVRSKTPGKIWEDGHIGWHTQFNQEFALLIVKECAKIAYECGPTVVNGSERQFNPITYTGNQILMHFEVEE